jgi:hypothetical protein
MLLSPAEIQARGLGFAAHPTSVSDAALCSARCFWCRKVVPASAQRLSLTER